MMTHDAISVLTSFKKDGKEAPKRLNADDPANTQAILQQFGQI